MMKTSQTMMTPRFIQVLGVRESRSAHGVGHFHVKLDQRHEENVVTQAEQFRVEAVVRLMDVMEVATPDHNSAFMKEA